MLRKKDESFRRRFTLILYSLYNLYTIIIFCKCASSNALLRSSSYLYHVNNSLDRKTMQLLFHGD